MALETVEIQDVIDPQFEEVQEESPGMEETVVISAIETCETPETCGTTEIETFGITETEVCVMLGT